MYGKPKLVSNTQIYLDCTKLLNEILDTVPNFPKSYQFTIGSRMQELAVNLLSYISAAYLNRNKETRIDNLTDFQRDFVVLKTLPRVAGERKWIKGISRHANIIELTDAIGKQSTAWKNSLLKLGRDDNE